MTHRQAMQIVEQQGGTAGEHVTRQTTLLVIGEEGWPLEADGSSSVKLQQAQRWVREGIDLRIVQESEWLGFVGLDGHRQELHRPYTPAMLSQLLEIPVNEIRRWERIGLIRAVHHVYRLPYFDFQEVASVRKLSQLISSGVPIREIQDSFSRLRDVLKSVARPLAQLELLARGQHLGYRNAEGRLLTLSGQRLFDFAAAADEKNPGEMGNAEAPPPLPFQEEDRTGWTSLQHFAEACRLADAGELESAVEALRSCLLDEPAHLAAQFQLAELLYRLQNPRGALERYHMVVALDHNYLEAWTQLGCLYGELGEIPHALEALEIALSIHPDYPEAHLQKAELLHQAGKSAEAVPHWRRYLEFEQRGPWAAAARKRLEEFDV